MTWVDSHCRDGTTSQDETCTREVCTALLGFLVKTFLAPEEIKIAREKSEEKRDQTRKKENRVDFAEAWLESVEEGTRKTWLLVSSAFDDAASSTMT